MTDDKSYEEILKEIQNIPQDYGRVFIYAPEGGPGYPLNSAGDIDFLSIDKDIFRFGGESHFYLDVRSGPHLLTATNVLVKGFASHKKQYGRNRLEINLTDQQVIYLQLVNQGRSKSINDRDFGFHVVEKNVAEKELNNLTFWNNREKTMETGLKIRKGRPEGCQGHRFAQVLSSLPAPP